MVWCVGGADVRGKVCLCLSTILILTHSSRNSQSLLFSIIKGARRFAAAAELLAELNRLPLGEHPWSLASKELWQLSCRICQPLGSHIPMLQKLFRRERRRISLPGDFHRGASVEGNECVAQSGSHCLSVDTFPEPVWLWSRLTWMLRIELYCNSIGWKFGSTKLSQGVICKLLLGHHGLLNPFLLQLRMSCVWPFSAGVNKEGNT